MSYKVISEFIDKDGHFYGLDFDYPLEGAETPTDERIKLLLGGKDKHSFIAINGDVKDETPIQEPDEPVELTASELEKLGNKELQAMLADDQYNSRTTKKELIAAILKD